VDAINDWLVSAGIAAEKISQSTNKQWMQFDASAEELESLLNTKYHVYEHTKTGKQTVACDEYKVPSHVQEHVDYITPGIKLFTPEKPRSAQPEGGIQRRGDFALPPLLKNLGMTLEALLAIPELLACSAAITPPCIASMNVILSSLL